MKNLDPTYDELSRMVHTSYSENQSIRQTMRETNLPFDEVWDMTGYKDWMDFYEDDQP